MKKISLLSAFFLAITLFPLISMSQSRNEWVNQVIIANGGRFESQPPYADYVTVQTYDPATKTTTDFDIIHTQSVQDVIINDHYAYVAAQDSIIMYDIDTYQRVAAVVDSGLSRLGIYFDRLIVTKQYPIKRFFVEILNANNLALLARVDGISGDCADVYAAKDSLYVAVNGGFLGTEGKMAIISALGWTLGREVNFGPQAVGINNLYEYAGIIDAVNKTPYGASPVGSITAYNTFSKTFTNTVLDVKLGDGLGNINNILYVMMNDGIGSYNLDTHQIIDTTIISDPGFANHLYITSGATDYVDNYLYLNIGDRAAFGLDVVTTTAGDSITSFQTGINADAIALEYKTPVGIGNSGENASSVSIFPNPVRDNMKVNLSQGSIQEVSVIDVSGRKLLTSTGTRQSSMILDCSSLPAGLYFLTVNTGNGTVSRKFMKQ